MVTTTHKLKIDRLKSIIDKINIKKSISLVDLERTLNVSRVTIQRDLVELENNGLIKRFHGGAMSLDYSNSLYDHGVRKTINVDVKKKIARKAASIIKSGNYVGMDSSSTVYYVSECVLPKNTFVVTCGIDTFENLSKNNSINTILTGGRRNSVTNTLNGPEAIDTIKKFRFDLALISARSFIPGSGFFDPYEDEVQIKKTLIESSAKVAILLDSSKIEKSGGSIVCPESTVDYLIVEDSSNPELKKIFKDRLI